MPGIRIHHREKRDCIVQVPHMGRQTAAGPKVYNIRLDEEGDAIVSPKVWERIQEALQLLGAPSVFFVMNEVLEPPDLIVGGQERDRRVFLQTDALREVAP